MPTITVTVTDNATDRLGNIGPSARQALLNVVRPLSRDMADDVRGRAAAHIHTVGKKPGAYLASIQQGVYDKGKRLGGFVRSGSPLAHLLEYGAHPPPHEIQAKAADVLRFNGSAGDVFRRAVQHPGATIPPYPAFGPAVAAHRDQIANALANAVKDAARKR
jgi:hypothetical protein